MNFHKFRIAYMAVRELMPSVVKVFASGPAPGGIVVELMRSQRAGASISELQDRLDHREETQDKAVLGTESGMVNGRLPGIGFLRWNIPPRIWLRDGPTCRSVPKSRDYTRP